MEEETPQTNCKDEEKESETDNFGDDDEHNIMSVASEEQAGPSSLQQPNEGPRVRIMDLNNKAGMEGLDVDKINYIIQNSSKGSKFYEHKKKRQEQLDQKINAMKSQVDALTEEAISRSEKHVDAIALTMENERDLSRVIVHIDMDAFYASVEMRDDPSLRNKPMAVGGNSMLCTSNYHARKFGVRAAMPGFIGRKLCPQLIIVPVNFPKYSKASKQVEEVLIEYDSEVSMHMDEAYFDITEHLVKRNSLLDNTQQVTPEEVVHEIRGKIFEKTQLTASAGIASNGLLAKICGDIRKPNNQYYLESNVDAIKNFMKTLPIRKVCGIGAVTEQMLKGLEIHTCGDLWDKRALVNLLFKPATSSFLLAVALGVGNSFLSKESGSDDRKSVSCERTFSETSDRATLKEWCKELCEELENDLHRKGVSGKTITLKIKTINFEVKTRAKSLSSYTSFAAVIFDTAWSIYCSYEQEIENLKLRLMGVRVSNLRFKNENSAESEDFSEFGNKQKTIDQMFAKTHEKNESRYTCPVCEEIFNSLKEMNLHIDVCLVSPEPTTTNEPENDKEIKISPEENENVIPEELPQNLETVVSCPVCNVKFEFKSETEAEERMNFHIDECLNQTTVKELVKETNNKGSSLKRPHDNYGSSLRPNKKKKSNSITIDSYFKPSN